MSDILLYHHAAHEYWTINAVECLFVAFGYGCGYEMFGPFETIRDLMLAGF